VAVKIVVVNVVVGCCDKEGVTLAALKCSSSVFVFARICASEYAASASSVCGMAIAISTTNPTGRHITGADPLDRLGIEFRLDKGLQRHRKEWRARQVKTNARKIGGKGRRGTRCTANVRTVPQNEGEA
jgi:hypothetical protein